MKIMTLLGFLVLLTTSPMTNSFPGQFIAVPLPILVYNPKPVAGSIFGLLALAVIAFRLLLRPSPTNKPSTTNEPSTTIKPSTTNKPPPECPSGYTLNETACGRFCYRLESQVCMTFENARAACTSDGADLLEPDVCSYPLFRDLANQREGPCFYKDYWVGGFRILPEVNYTTVRGTALPDNFQYWAVGQPSKLSNGSEEEACVLIDKNLDHKLNDFICKLRIGYICQKFI